MTLFKNNSSGQIVLAYILLVSGIVVEVAIAGAFVAYLSSSGALGNRLSKRAESASYSGVYDAVRKISENKEFGNQTPYCMAVDTDVVEVRVSRYSDTPSRSYRYTIQSVGRAGNRYSQLQVVLVVDSKNGIVYMQSIEEQDATPINAC